MAVRDPRSDRRFSLIRDYLSLQEKIAPDQREDEREEALAAANEPEARQD
ncbi:MAG: hypothetical protein V3V06_03305 [Dehalococcoidia bacterium]